MPAKDVFSEHSGTAAALLPAPPAPWVAAMQEFYRKNGYYRAEDLNRLLGDPRTSVSVEALPCLSSNSVS